MRTPLTIAACVGLVAAAPSTAWAQRFPFDRSFDVAGPAQIDVGTLRGKIEIVAGEPGRIVVAGAATVRVGWNVPADAVELARQVAVGPADRPAAWTDQNSLTAHAKLVEKAKQGRIDVYFAGDSIVRRWGALDYPELLANWRKNFFGWNAGNFGWGADRTENILWRLENGELDGVNPKVIVLLAGTNNVGAQPRDDLTIAEIARGVKAIVDLCRRKAPDAIIVLTAVFPRHDNIAVMPTINRLNQKLATFADGARVRFLSINDRLVSPDGTLVEGVLHERDKLHPSLKGYQIWADALKPIFRELLGPPGTTDLAPPPTGDPSASGRAPRGRRTQRRD